MIKVFFVIMITDRVPQKNIHFSRKALTVTPVPVD